MHSHGGGERTSKVLRISLVVTLVYIVLLVVAGIRAHSLALLSEAGHNLSDFVARCCAFAGCGLSAVPPTQFHQDLWLPPGGRAGRPGQRGFTGCGLGLHLLRSVPAVAEPRARARRHDDLSLWPPPGW